MNRERIFLRVYKILSISASIFTMSMLVNCNDDKIQKDIILQDFGEMKVQLPDNSNFIVLTKDIDINLDGHPDYLITLTRFQKDDIYYNENAFYIKLQGITTYLQVDNLFEPIVLIDDEKPVRQINDISMLYMTRYSQINDQISDIEKNSSQALMSMTDEYETIQPIGIKYIPLVMNKNGKNYYGWIEASLDQNSITIQKTAFCLTADKKIKVGTID